MEKAPLEISPRENYRSECKNDRETFMWLYCAFVWLHFLFHMFYPLVSNKKRHFHFALPDSLGAPIFFIRCHISKNQICCLMWFTSIGLSHLRGAPRVHRVSYRSQNPIASDRTITAVPQPRISLRFCRFLNDTSLRVIGLILLSSSRLLIK